MNIFRELYDDAKAIVRGDKRIGRGLRGRVFTSTGIFSRFMNKSSLMAPKAQGEPGIRVAAVIDGETGKAYTADDWRNRTDRK